MRGLKAATGLMALLVLAGTGVRGSAAPVPREVLGGELIVKDALEKMDAPPGQTRYLADAELARAFPRDLFYVVAYPPAAAAGLPEPLKATNLFAVDPDGRATLLAGDKELAALFKASFVPPREAERSTAAVRAALLLLRARYTGYTFALPEADIRVTNDPRGGRQAVGNLVVKEGGRGAVLVTLTLDPAGDVVRVVEKARLEPADPTVVKVTAGAIAAAEKLVRVHLTGANITVESVKYVEDPVLVEAFPGHLFFRAPAADPARQEAGRGEVLKVFVVGPDGTVQELFAAAGSFGRLFTTMFGPVTDDRRLEAALRVVERLLEATHPADHFGTPEPPRITSEEGGVKVITTRVPETGPAGRSGYLQIRLTFGKVGRLIAWAWGFHRA
jgi:hypothetical protein